MRTQIPPTATTVHSVHSVLSVDPTVMAIGAQPAVAAAAALRSCAAVLAPAWLGAAQAMAARLTGSALSVSEAAVISGLGSCAQSLESLGRALAEAAGVYRDSDASVAASVADAALTGVRA